MAKAATIKDVLYALEFLGEQLVRYPPEPPKRNTTWLLPKSKVNVPQDVVDKIRQNSNLVAIDDFRFGWRAPA